MASTPRPLIALAIDDKFGSQGKDEFFSSLPIEVVLCSKWSKFCDDLRKSFLPTYEILLVDFNFDEDTGSPPFPMEKTVPPDFADEPLLKNLAWSNRLEHKTSGILIGATLCGMGTYRDIPVGSAVYTGWPGILMNDMATAMLVSQILNCTGYDIRTGNFAFCLEDTISTIKSGPTSFTSALPVAVQRFRINFLKRAAPRQVASEDKPMLSIDTPSLIGLLEGFKTMDSEKSLNDLLLKQGIICYDRNGKKHHFDVRSLFVDQLIYFEKGDDGQTTSELPLIRDHLPLETIKPGGVVLDFLESLVGDLDIMPYVDYLRNDVPRGINVNGRFPKAEHHEFQRFLTFLFAWCGEYCSRVENSWQAYDPLGMDRDLEDESLPSRQQQLTILRRILAPYENQWLPLSSKEDLSIMKILNQFTVDNNLTDLHIALGYDSEAISTDRRKSGVRRLLNAFELILKDPSSESYLLKPGCYNPTPRFNICDVAERLGFDPKKQPTNSLHRLIMNYKNISNKEAKSFYWSLFDTPLGKFFQERCTEYIEEEFPNLAVDRWPTAVLGE